MPTLRVLGLDPGSSVTGFGLVESDGRRHAAVEYGAIRLLARAPFAERLLVLGDRLESLIARIHPDQIAIEDVFAGLNVKSALKLGQVRGVAMHVAGQARIPIAEYSPLEVKRAVVGYGRAEKHQVQLMIKTLLGLAEVPQPHDAADALAIAICHLYRTETASRLASPGAFNR